MDRQIGNKVFVKFKDKDGTKWIKSYKMTGAQIGTQIFKKITLIVIIKVIYAHYKRLVNEGRK